MNDDIDAKRERAIRWFRLMCSTIAGAAMVLMVHKTQDGNVLLAFILGFACAWMAPGPAKPTR